MLDPKQVQALLAVHSEGSFQAAARALNVTPSAITLRIKALEALIGSRVLIRAKTLTLTPQGRAIIAYAQRTRLLDEELLRTLSLDTQAYRGGQHWSSLRVAINADSLSTWFLPGVAQALTEQHILVDIVIDDQDYTQEALAKGEVLGCVTTLSKPLKGCVAEPLGVMRYGAWAHPDLLTRCTLPSGKLSVHKLLAQPAIIFNRKDSMHDRFVQQFLGLSRPSYPKYFVPALDAFERSIELGIGWGVVPQALHHEQSTLSLRPQESTQMAEVVPGAFLEVSLYWQHWERETGAAAALTAAIKQAAKRYLRP